MKKYASIFALIAASVLMTGGANAGSTSGSVTLNATVAAGCTLTQTSAQQTYNLPSITDASGNVVPQTLSAVAVGSVSCNGAATVTANSTKGGLKNGTGSCTSTTCISYDASIKVGSTQGNTINVAGSVPASPSSVSLTGTTSGASIMLTVAPTTTFAANVGAGTYSDVVALVVNF